MAAASPARVETSLETKSITVVWKIGDVSDRVAATAAPSIVESSHFDNKRWYLRLAGSYRRDGQMLFDSLIPTLRLAPRIPNGVACIWLLTTQRASSGTMGSIGVASRQPLSASSSTHKRTWSSTRGLRNKVWSADSRTGEGWGWTKWRKRDDALFKEPSLSLRVTLSVTPYLPCAPLPQPPPPRPLFSDSLATAYKTFFENEQASDVRFLIGQEGSPRRLLRANKAFLSKRSEYYRSMFSSDFSEGASGNIDSEDRPNKRRKVERSSGPSPSPEAGSAPSAWQDDDDSLEWLPQEWLEEHGPQDVKEEPVEGGEADEGVIKVTDAGYITYRAMLYFLYTERITFTPSASNFTVALAANETNNQSRRAYLLSKSQGGDGDVEPASPHAVYRLADKLDMGELKELARDAIVSGFTAENILYELISSFAYHYDGIQKAALDFAWKNWDAVKSTPAFARVLAGASDIEGGSTILAKLVMGTTVAKAG